MAASARSQDRDLLTRLLGCTLLADRALAEFGTFPAALQADRARLSRIVGPRATLLLQAMREGFIRVARADLDERLLLQMPTQLIDYLRISMGRSAVEALWVVFLDSGNRLLADEEVARGSIRDVPVFPREIVRRAIEHGAASIILAHNHPSGSLKPSRADVAATRRISQAAAALEIGLHDHLIITRSGWVSMRSEGLV